MKKLLISTIVAGAIAMPVYAALEAGASAPDFTAPASLNGEAFTYSLKDSLAKGPTVVYFYPSAYTQGCNIQAREFALNMDNFTAAGATIVDVEVPAFGYALTAYYLIAPAEASSNLARFDGVRFGLRVDSPDTNSMYSATRAAGFGDEVKRRIMLGTYALSAGYYDAYYGRALKVRKLVHDDFARAYQQADVLLTPTSPTVAFPFGAKGDNPLQMYLCDLYTIPTNLAGHPGMSVPFGTGADGLPVGVQVLAGTLDEASMFRVGAALERTAISEGARS
jgi:aspartyl-tRNA(Asn)/glutamyl-tRNA(Gln) amidotransferase subunit A